MVEGAAHCSIEAFHMTIDQRRLRGVNSADIRSSGASEGIFLDSKYIISQMNFSLFRHQQSVADHVLLSAVLML